mmetsp:Transcript_56302/g.89406  ORF Transcript_56302/g.89406 Transcript_56302/m.89406 type:complete len:592 (+) Transcript_56302:89-1864(+)
MTASEPQIGGPVFKEYLKYIDAKSFMVEKGSIGKLSAKDCLLVIDMQNDFISFQAEHNCCNSRFASTESLDIVPPICSLMEAFHSAGGVVIATKDYHPWDHCSFIGSTDVNFAPRKNQIFGQSAGFPPHCVQGSAGCNFYKDIRDTMCKLMQADNDRLSAEGRTCGQCRAQSKVQVAWKGFHEAVDSFGGIEYPPDISIGRFKDVYKKSPCQLSCWTGSVILKSSNMVAWESALKPEDVDAPPDILAMTFGNSPTPIHQFVRNIGCERVFVCGLVLDVCVVDTCLNAIAKGFDTHMVIDATRPAHVPGFGAYGEGAALGFVNDPLSVKEWIEKSKLPLVPTCELVPQAAMEELWKQGLPRLDVAAPEKEGFPSKLQLLIKPTRTPGLKCISRPTADTVGQYSVKDLPEMATLRLYDFRTEGTISPVSAVTLNDAEKQAVGIPVAASQFAFAYPVDGSENIAKIRESSPHTLQCFTQPNLFFTCFGGYLYFSASGALVGCTAVAGGSVDEGAHEMKPAVDWDDSELVKKLQAAGRFKPVTLPALEAAGVKAFAWVLPKEASDAAKNGGFLYLFHDASKPAPADCRKPLFFPF